MQKTKPNMKILIIGAGVLGSLYGAKLAKAGMDVTLVARGKRLEDIQKNGIVLEKFEDGTQTRTEVKVLDHMPRDAFFLTCAWCWSERNSSMMPLTNLKKIPASRPFCLWSIPPKAPRL